MFYIEFTLNEARMSKICSLNRVARCKKCDCLLKISTYSFIYCIWLGFFIYTLFDINVIMGFMPAIVHVKV